MRIKVKELIKEGGNFRSQLSIAGSTVHFAANTGSYEAVKYFLEEGKFPVNSTSLLGNTLAHEAASGGHKDIVTLLAEFGADLGRLNKFGETPYVLAKRKRFKSCANLIKKLLQEDHIPMKVYKDEINSHFEGKKMKDLLWNRKLKPWEGYAFKRQLEDGQIGGKGEKKLQLQYFAKSLTDSYVHDAIETVTYNRIEKRKILQQIDSTDVSPIDRSEYKSNYIPNEFNSSTYDSKRRPSLTEKIKRINLKRKEELKTGSG